MIDVSIIIVSYNTKDILLECIQSIVSTAKDVRYEIIIVDNASVDGTVEEISNIKFPISNIKFIQNKENLGFSKANNIGVGKATGKYILFLNSDTVVHKDTIKTMVEFMDAHTDAGAATCKVQLPNGELDDASHRGFPTPWNAFCHFSGLSQIFSKSRIFAGYSLGWKDLSSIHEIDALAGAFMMVRREAGDKVVWWDKDYFWYGEDLDFCYRLKEKGWKIYFVPTVSILHYKGVSGGLKKSSEHITKASSETRKRATHARFEAMEIFYKKHYNNKYPKLLTWLILRGIELKRTVALRQV